MKWYTTQSAPIADGINTVKIVQKEMGSEAANLIYKWENRPTVTRVTGQQEVPVFTEVLDVDGNPVLDEFGMPTSTQTGTQMVDIIERVEYPYLVLDNGLRGATDAERASIDAKLAELTAASAAAKQLQKPVELRAIENLFMILCSAIELQADLTQATKLSFQVLPGHLAQGQADPTYLTGVLQIINAYAAVLTAMSITIPTDLAGLKELAAYINSAGVYYSVKWWDDCQVHPELLA